jgi:hypothetical protein
MTLSAFFFDRRCNKVCTVPYLEATAGLRPQIGHPAALYIFHFDWHLLLSANNWFITCWFGYTTLIMARELLLVNCCSGLYLRVACVLMSLTIDVDGVNTLLFCDSERFRSIVPGLA